MATPSPTTTIETDRLFLRPLSAADTDAVFALRSHPQVATVTRHGRPETRTESDKWLKERLESGICLSYCVELRLSPRDGNPTTTTTRGQVIGLTGAHRLPEVGYLFLPEYWGKGYATEALKAWIEWYWRTFPGGRGGKAYLEAMTGPEGANSRKVLRKCGFSWWRKEEKGIEEDGDGDDDDDGKEPVLLDTWKMEKPS